MRSSVSFMKDIIKSVNMPILYSGSWLRSLSLLCRFDLKIIVNLRIIINLISFKSSFDAVKREGMFQEAWQIKINLFEGLADGHAIAVIGSQHQMWAKVANNTTSEWFFYSCSYSTFGHILYTSINSKSPMQAKRVWEQNGVRDPADRLRQNWHPRVLLERNLFILREYSSTLCWPCGQYWKRWSVQEMGDR